jgi:hypothetical protein
VRRIPPLVGGVGAGGLRVGAGGGGGGVGGVGAGGVGGGGGAQAGDLEVLAQGLLRLRASRTLHRTFTKS